MKARYLSFFSYIGSNFRSSEKIWIKQGANLPDPESVQGLIELALLKTRSLNYPKVTLSSRTDGGVHALQSSAHFDLERFGLEIYDPEAIKGILNKTFYRNNTSIFVNKCLRVNDNFDARRNAKSRTYLYRFAVLKDEVPLPDLPELSSYIPIEEWKRCHFVRFRNFDISKFNEGAKYFVGYHDFSTFKKFDKKLSNKHNRRLLYSIDVRPGKPLVTSYRSEESLFHYWDVEIRGRAFVHNQIRRMIAALFSVAIGKLPVEEIKVMLQVPSKLSWYSFISTVPPDGLFLCNVEYDPQDLVYQGDKVTTSGDIVSDCNDDDELDMEEDCHDHGVVLKS